MPALLRSLLVWLMVLTLPHLGLAASFTPHCAPAGSAMPAPASTAGATDRHDHVHAPERAAQVAGPAVLGSAHAAAGGLDLGQGLAAEGAGTCSVCAACCAAIGMPPSLGTTPPSVGATRSLQWPPTDIESFVPGGLDRPPRTPLA